MLPRAIVLCCSHTGLRARCAAFVCAFFQQACRRATPYRLCTHPSTLPPTAFRLHLRLRLPHRLRAVACRAWAPPSAFLASLLLLPSGILRRACAAASTPHAHLHCTRPLLLPLPAACLCPLLPATRAALPRAICRRAAWRRRCIHSGRLPVARHPNRDLHTALSRGF